MLHFAGRVAFGVDVGNFLELQGAFQGQGVVDAPGQVQEIGGLEVFLADRLNLGVGFEDFLEDVRQAHEFPDHGLARFRLEPSPVVGQVHGQQIQADELGGEGLGRGHADFRAGLGVDDGVHASGDGRTHHIADGQGAGLFGDALAHGGQGVGRFAGLGDEHQQGFFRR